MKMLFLFALCIGTVVAVVRAVAWALHADWVEKGNRIADDEIEALRQFHKDFDGAISKILRRGS